ncbi:hypothetical protein [Solicola sp. PLA-1-18]|uniref:hypothetical protein n=1 Tax=Solicola sp. PLA-1-18 TaxID=3380532 RepID=UPI003B7DD5C4
MNLPTRNRTTHRVLARRAAAVVGGSVLALGSAVAVGQPASADPGAGWKLISSARKCTTYSFGTQCQTQKTYMRTIKYCERPPISNPWSSMAWATTCIRYEMTG